MVISMLTSTDFNQGKTFERARVRFSSMYGMKGSINS